MPYPDETYSDATLMKHVSVDCTIYTYMLCKNKLELELELELELTSL